MVPTDNPLPYIPLHVIIMLLRIKFLNLYLIRRQQRVYKMVFANSGNRMHLRLHSSYYDARVSQYNESFMPRTMRYGNFCNFIMGTKRYEYQNHIGDIKRIPFTKRNHGLELPPDCGRQYTSNAAIGQTSRRLF